MTSSLVLHRQPGWILVALGAGVLLGACPPVHPDTDAGVADSGSDAGANDRGSDAGTPTCLEQVVVDQPFDIDPAGLGTQIHADAVYDGQGIWVVYNQPDEGSNFDVYLTRVGCDGSVQIAPQRINTTLTGNHIDPCLILVDGGLVVAWSADNQTGENNMDIYYRTFDRTGAPTMSTDRTLETAYQSNPVAGNVMDPALAPLPDGAFALAGIRGLDVTNTFQVFVQRLTAAGAPDGVAIDVVIEQGMTHRYPTLAATANGELYLAYAIESEASDVSLVHSHLPAGSATWDPLPPALVAASADGVSGSYAIDRTSGRNLLALGRDSNILVEDGASFGATGRTLAIGTEAGDDHSPRLLLAPGGGAVFWYRTQSGYFGQFRAQGFADDGSTLTAASPRVVTTARVPMLYGAAAAHIEGSIYFTAWSEGTSPDFVIKGVFVDLAP